MPWGDGTGPLGLGPMTGRGAGYCAGFPVPGFMNPWPRGFGLGFGRGRGRGFRFWARFTGLPGWYRASIGLPAFGAWRAFAIPAYIPWIGSQSFATPAQIPVINPYTASKKDEMKLLEEEKRAIEEEMKLLREDLKEIEKRINELKKKS